MFYIMFFMIFHKKINSQKNAHRPLFPDNDDIYIHMEAISSGLLSYRENDEVSADAAEDADTA